MEPDYTALSDIIDIGDNFDHIVDDSSISHTLSSVAVNASLGDTNIAVPGRLLGCVQAYSLFNTEKRKLDQLFFLAEPDVAFFPICLQFV